jgi:hypothetical protein
MWTYSLLSGPMLMFEIWWLCPCVSGCMLRRMVRVVIVRPPSLLCSRSTLG